MEKWAVLALLLSVVVGVNSQTDKLPKMKNWPDPVKYIDKDETISERCPTEDDENNPAYTYSWFRNGKELSFQGGAGSVVEGITIGGNNGIQLTVGDFRNGTFQCIAKNAKGAAGVSGYFTVKRKSLGSWSPPSIPNLLSPTKGEHLKVPCKDRPESSPEGTVRWYVEEGGGPRRRFPPQSNDQESVEMRRRIVIDGDGVLNFIGVEESDGGAGKQYHCSVFNNELNQESYSVHRISIIVKAGQALDRTLELIYAQNVVAEAGDTAELMCIFSSWNPGNVPIVDKVPTVTWYIPPGDKRFTQDLNLDPAGTILKIQDVAISDEKKYTCTGRTPGKGQQSSSVKLTVKAPPMWAVNGSMVQQKVPIGRTATFTCKHQVHGTMNSAVTWMWNGRKIGVASDVSECSSDEIRCRSSPNQWICAMKCDNIPQCQDGSDEQECTDNLGGCPESETQRPCLSSGCVLKTQFCDGNADCSDGSDERPSVCGCDINKIQCKDKFSCVDQADICNNVAQCKDGSDEFHCPYQQSRTVALPATSRLVEISGDTTQLTMKNVKKDDMACFQCEVRNKDTADGVSFGDACLEVIEPIEITKGPDPEYWIKEGGEVDINVTATTDASVENLKFYWFMFTQGGRERILPNNIYKLSMDGKRFHLYSEKALDDELASIFTTYQLEVWHDYDHVYRNFSVKLNGTIVSTPAPVVQAASLNLWFVALIVGVLILFVVIALIICFLYRNRGGTYPLDKKEHQAGHDPEKELKDAGFHDVGRVDDDDDEKPKPDEVSLSESVQPYESDEDIADEYGGDMMDISKFNEDGSFIGLYGEKKSKGGKQANQSTV